MALFVVSTPIGNLQDVTLRALEVLSEADLIAAEDTRRTIKLLKAHSIEYKEMVSFNDHNMVFRTKKVLVSLRQGLNVALVSDAGTPGISDPGYYLIRAATDANINIVPVPGPSAFLTGLMGSGLPMDRFFYYGFLPKAKGKKVDALKLSLNKSFGSVVYYESPHRVHKTLDLLAEELPEVNVVIARELTKKFEEFIRGKPREIVESLGSKKLKGEITLVLSSKR
ncbi:16S rRNA (cytidine(1402)-2'-O)-methyltransferase [Candidatus Woesearchaeota archaeon]|nr:16S rRNA (cytidine(1402)-2'-O)-methyltransferase [Candidatus Woesearchaeota archaeon]